MKLFVHPASGHAYKVRLMLAFADIPYDSEEIDIFSPRESRPEDFRLNSKFSEVPTLIDEGEAFVQSNAILLHLAQKHQVLGGQDKVQLNRCKEWLFWEANKIGMSLPQLRYAAMFDDHDLNEGALLWLRSRYDYDISIMENELSDGRAYFLGDEFSIADCSLAGYLYFADEAKLPVPKHVQAWLVRLAALPEWFHPYD